MSVTRLVVVGASAGGIDAITRLAATMPSDFPAAICVVLHSGPQSPGVLHGILDRAGPLTAHAVHGAERPQPGHIYVAPPDHHLVVEPNRLRLTKGPRENRFRPAIDPLFRSAAQVYGPAAIGVVLTGTSTMERRGCGQSSSWAAWPSCRIPPTRRFPPCRPVPFSTST